MTDTDTITIPRDLFERLCEAAIELRGNSYWKKSESRFGYADDYAALSLTCDEAVAIRDGGTDLCQHRQS